MEMCTTITVSRIQQKRSPLTLFQRQDQPKLTKPIVYAVRFRGWGGESYSSYSHQKPTYRQGSFLAMPELAAHTHTHTHRVT